MESVEVILRRIQDAADSGNLKFTEKCIGDIRFREIEPAQVAELHESIVKPKSELHLQAAIAVLAVSEPTLELKPVSGALVQALLNAARSQEKYSDRGLATVYIGKIAPWVGNGAAVATRLWDGWMGCPHEQKHYKDFALLSAAAYWPFLNRRRFLDLLGILATHLRAAVLMLNEGKIDYQIVDRARKSLDLYCLCCARIEGTCPIPKSQTDVEDLAKRIPHVVLNVSRLSDFAWFTARIRFAAKAELPEYFLLTDFPLDPVEGPPPSERSISAQDLSLYFWLRTEALSACGFICGASECLADDLLALYRCEQSKHQWRPRQAAGTALMGLSLRHEGILGDDKLWTPEIFESFVRGLAGPPLYHSVALIRSLQLLTLIPGREPETREMLEHTAMHVPTRRARALAYQALQAFGTEPKF